MRRLFILLLAANLILLLGRTWHDVAATTRGAGAGAGGASNGDTNGDGGRDISDAVYLLTWLFNGGPEPVACANGDLEGRVARLEGIISSCLPDTDQDGNPDCAQPDRDLDRDGFPATTDCNDGNPQIFPGATEVCDAQDNNCDGATDENFNLLTDVNNCGDCGRRCPFGTVCSGGQCVQAQRDDDQDGFTSDVDCDDTDARTFPGAAEVCDARDNDCDGQIDEGAGSFCFPCVQGVETARDCDDGNPCTNDVCDVAQESCRSTVAPNGTACPGGVCQNGTCVQQ